jgi:hypothetical protein
MYRMFQLTDRFNGDLIKCEPADRSGSGDPIQRRRKPLECEHVTDMYEPHVLSSRTIRRGSQSLGRQERDED